MTKFNIGVLGCASIAKRSMIPAFLASGKISLVAVASRDKTKAQSFADEFHCEAILGYQNLLDRPDIQAVYIPLPTGLHYEWIMKSLNAGKHVIAEKSLALTLKEVEDITFLASQKKLVVYENFMFLHHRQLSFVKELVDSGKIGEIHLLRSSFGFSSLAPGDIRFQNDLGGGALLDVGTYTLKAVQYFLGNDLHVCASSLKSNLANKVDTCGSISLKNGTGQVAQLSFGFEHFYQCALELWGSKGRITMERIFTAPATLTPKIKIETVEQVQEILVPSDNHFINIVNAFANDVLSDYYKDHRAELLNQARLLEEVRKLAYNQ